MKNPFTMKELIPIAGSFFVFLCITKAMIYYSYFGIRIIDYISFSESILLFFDDLLLLVLPALLMITYPFFFSGFLKKRIIFNRFMKIVIYLILSSMVILYLVYLTLLFIKYFNFSVFFTICFLYLSLIVFTFPFFFILINFMQQRDRLDTLKNSNRILIIQKKFFNYYISWCIFVSIAGGGIQSLYKDLKNTMAQDPERIFKCEFKNGTTAQSSKDTLYIGRSVNYVFFYEINSKKALIYKNDELRSIEIQTLKKRKQKTFDYF